MLFLLIVKATIDALSADGQDNSGVLSDTSRD